MGNEQIKPTVAHSADWTFIKEIKAHPLFGHIKVYRGPNDQLQCLKTVVVEESTYREQMESYKKMIVKDVLQQSQVQCSSLVCVNRLESQKQEEFCSNYVKIYLTADYSDQSVREIGDVKKFMVDVLQALEIMDQKGINNCQFCLSKVLQFGEKVKVVNTQLFTETSDYESLYMNDVRKEDWMVAPEVMNSLKFSHPPSFNSQQAVAFNFGIMMLTLLTGINPIAAEIYNYKDLELTSKFDGYVAQIDNLQISNNIKSVLQECLSRQPTKRPLLKEILGRLRQLEIPLQVSQLKEEDQVQNMVSFNPCYEDVKKVLSDSNINKNLNFHNSSPSKNEKQEVPQFRKSKQLYNLENTYQRQSVQNKQMLSAASMKSQTKTLQKAKSPNKKPKMMKAHHYK